MKNNLKFAALIALLFAFVSIPVRNAHAEEKYDAKDQAAVVSANKVLDGVYGNLMSKTEDSQEKTSLRNAQHAWIKWRDAEAEYIGRHGGAVGGSALRGDFAVAQLKLINERIAVLKAYASQAPKD
jgi:uncharacterized protein YecT (DUF1311 family)